MKKITTISLALMAAFGMSLTVYADERISPEEVPQPLQHFVTNNFGPETKIVKASRDKKHGGYEYDLKLDNGVEVDYGVAGHWVEIDAKKSNTHIPYSILGQDLWQKLAKKYPNRTVKKIEREYQGYEITLDNGIHLFASNDGSISRIHND
ncbi:MAG: PepSY-like domain-containing protein [Bacteroidales bacterium]|nr:PepSY-like domain-containing protein [Bacteroidales bacterium]